MKRFEKEYTLGFIKCGTKILLLNRNKPGWMGCWNGIGGSVEEGETFLEGMIREMFEETEITKYKSIEYKGYTSWDYLNDDIVLSARAHIYLIEVEQLSFDDVKLINEGILQWKEINWIKHPYNKGIAKNVLPYIEKVLECDKKYIYHQKLNDYNDVEITELK